MIRLLNGRIMHCSLWILSNFSYLYLFTDTFAQSDFSSHKVEAKLGLSKILLCEMQVGSRQCSWKHYQKTYYSLYNSSQGYSVVGDPQKGHCHLKLHSVIMEDNGQWSCSIAGNTYDKSINLVVIKKPTAYFMEYNGKRIINGSIIPVQTDSETVEVACEAKGSMPKAIITWEGEDIDPSDYNEELLEGPNINGTFDVRNVLTLRIPQDDGDKAAKVTCMIAYSKHTKRAIKLEATFGKESETANVLLKAGIGTNKETILSCKADGIPVPHYHILMTIPRNESLTAHQGERRVTTEGGSFICLAGNHHNKPLIKSSEIHVKFALGSNESKELKAAETENVVGILSMILSVLSITFSITLCIWLRSKKYGDYTQNMTIAGQSKA